MMRVELSPTGKFEINLGDGVVHVLSREKALRLAAWIEELADSIKEEAVADFASKLYALADKWESEALQSVPKAYADRGLHYKYLALDNEASGLARAAEELRELLEECGLTTRSADSPSANR